MQVVAAIRYITNGSYLTMMKEMLETEVAEELRPLEVRVEEMVKRYEQSINYVKESGSQEVNDLLARRLYDMTAEIIMSLLILDDATRAPELFAKSANVYVRMAEENVVGKSLFVQNFIAEDIKFYRQTVKES